MEDHIYPIIAKEFGAVLVCDCINWGWLQRRYWQGEPTQFISLTGRGEGALADDALLQEMAV